MIRTFVLGLTLLGLLSASSLAATLYVNPQTGNDGWDGRCATSDGVTCGPKATIQAAIDAAADQDEVSLAAATYTGTGNRDVSFLGKAITVRSVDPNDPAVVAATVIDCQANKHDRHRAFNFITREGPASILSGVSIINGYAPLDFYYPPPSNVYLPHGGAILCRESSPTVDRCVMRNNWALAGGAIYSEGGSQVYPLLGSPMISGCTFTENVVRSDAMPGSGFYGALGGAIHLDSGSPVVLGCVFEHNVADYFGEGGAIFVTNNRAVLENNKIYGNTASSGGGGIACWMGGNPRIVACEISGNSTKTYDGGGIWANGASVSIWRSKINSNSAAQGVGGAVWANAVSVRDSEITGNSASRAAAIYAYSPYPPSVVITNCVLAGNRAAYLSTVRGPTVQIDNSIIWNGTAWLDPNATATVSYSDIQGGWQGTGNTAADPHFVDPGRWDNHGTPNDPNDDIWVPGDYHLLPGSPCIDAGDNLALPRDTLDLDHDGCTTELLPVDLDGYARRVDDPNTPDTGHGAAPLVDMGAHEFGSTAPPPPHPCPGDVNCDSVISYADINPFVAALLGEAGYAARYPDCWYMSADCNFDGVVDSADIGPFVALLGR